MSDEPRIPTYFQPPLFKVRKRSKPRHEPIHVTRARQRLTEKLSRPIQDDMKREVIPVDFPSPPLIEEIRRQAKLEGLSTAAFIRRLVCTHQDYKKLFKKHLE